MQVFTEDGLWLLPAVYRNTNLQFVIPALRTINDVSIWGLRHYIQALSVNVTNRGTAK